MNRLLLLIFLLTIVSCERKEKTLQQKQERITKKINKELNKNISKIVLLSNIENVSTEKVNLTMQDYFNAIYSKNYNLDKTEDYQNLISSISKSTRLSNKKTSSIIFAYIYEMRTKEEIGDEYLEDLQDKEEDYNDSFDYR